MLVRDHEAFALLVPLPVQICQSLLVGKLRDLVSQVHRRFIQFFDGFGERDTGIAMNGQLSVAMVALDVVRSRWNLQRCSARIAQQRFQTSHVKTNLDIC